jgi:antitoxin (DNA-binding transcriptional repressor) of toxin-antitoxin stability system
MKHQTVNVTEFKAKCLSMLNDIAERGGEITITKRGRALATVRPVHRRAKKSSENILKGKMTVPEGLEKMDLAHLFEVLGPHGWEPR